MEFSHLLARWRSVAGRERIDTPLIRWCIFFIGLIAIWLWVVEPLQQWRTSLREQVDRNAEKTVRLASLVEQADAWVDARQLAVATLEEEAASLFLQSTDTAAQAEMQKLLQQLCRNRGVTIFSQRPLPAEPERGIGRKLPVALDLRGNLVDILYLLDDIARSSHIFRVEDWTLQEDRKGMVARTTIAGFRGMAAEDPDEN